MQLKSASVCGQALPQAAARPAAKSSLRMGLEGITDTNGPLGGLKWFVFFGASFVPSLFLAGYFLGGYYPGLAVGAPQEPSWWPTSMQYAHGVNKGTLAVNVAKVEAKEKELAEAKAKAKVPPPSTASSARACLPALSASRVVFFSDTVCGGGRREVWGSSGGCVAGRRSDAAWRVHAEQSMCWHGAACRLP